MDEYVLISSTQGHRDDVVAWLSALENVRDVQVVRYGTFDVLARLRGPDHLSIVEVITNQLRFHEGVERVEEVGDEDDAAEVLQAVEATEAAGA